MQEGCGVGWPQESAQAVCLSLPQETGVPRTKSRPTKGAPSCCVC